MFYDAAKFHYYCLMDHRMKAIQDIEGRMLHVQKYNVLCNHLISYSSNDGITLPKGDFIPMIKEMFLLLEEKSPYYLHLYSTALQIKKEMTKLNMPMEGKLVSAFMIAYFSAFIEVLQKICPDPTEYALKKHYAFQRKKELFFEQVVFFYSVFDNREFLHNFEDLLRSFDQLDHEQYVRLKLDCLVSPAMVAEKTMEVGRWIWNNTEKVPLPPQTMAARKLQDSIHKKAVNLFSQRHITSYPSEQISQKPKPFNIAYEKKSLAQCKDLYILEEIQYEKIQKASDSEKRMKFLQHPEVYEYFKSHKELSYVIVNILFDNWQEVISGKLPLLKTIIKEL